jgi:hypothetical protein
MSVGGDAFFLLEGRDRSRHGAAVRAGLSRCVAKGHLEAVPIEQLDQIGGADFRVKAAIDVESGADEAICPVVGWPRADVAFLPAAMEGDVFSFGPSRLPFAAEQDVSDESAASTSTRSVN